MIEDRAQRIGRAFGQAASHYDDHASVQRVVAATLAQLLRLQPVAPAPDGRLRILEIGCGTGLLTRHLRSLFPDAEIIATDIAPEMIAVAEQGGDTGAHFLVMDGEHPAFEGAHFDLIASSLAFQWFSDLPRALDRLSALLRPGGSLMFATMAGRSFHEWRAAHEALGLQAGTPLYPDADALRAMLARHADAFLFEEDYAHDFGQARGLLAHLKGIGATVPVEGRAPLSAGDLRKVMRAYDDAGGTCTYHVAYCRVTQAA
ncbi:MAG: malonyl-ACP O-methyltransferase BioC [Sphingobium sp.]|jgi:malonyl-CoA O-methyltransferase|nr:malonyl-ACP O-methyltransferase BioC [Sphingobium sp.]MCI1272288.1 malonyl-ACP O-methyltransferase BioC [Sphingobium sp.]MCI2054303.1 malonyl-ACP O-methyltransferase BioC [Sphingobium sp.]